MHIASDARATVAMSAEEVNQVVAEAVAQALKKAGFGKGTLPKLTYSVSEAARVSSISRSAHYIAIKHRGQRIVEKGRRSLIQATDLERWLLKDQPPTSE